MNDTCFLLSEISGEGTDQVGQEKGEEDDAVKALHRFIIRDGRELLFLYSYLLF